MGTCESRIAQMLTQMATKAEAAPAGAAMAEGLLADATIMTAVGPWVLVWKHCGLEAALSRMTTYYSNLGLVAALLATICAAIVTNPATADDGDDSLAHRVQGFSGFVGFAAAVGCVIDCILITNTCTLTATGRQFAYFLTEQHFFLYVPVYLFIIVCATALIQTMAAAYVLYDFDTFLGSSLIMFLGAGLLLRRYYVMRMHVNEATRLEAGSGPRHTHTSPSAMH